jgi:Tol biopolymer transport system component
LPTRPCVLGNFSPEVPGSEHIEWPESPVTIYVIGTDGSGLRPGHSTDIFFVALGGGAPHRITSGGVEDRHPRASARGGLLTFQRRLPRSSTVAIAKDHIYVSRADGTKLRDLTPNLPRRLFASDPEFSPDGRRIAYSTSDRVISVRTDGTVRGS